MTRGLQYFKYQAEKTSLFIEYHEFADVLNGCLNQSVLHAINKYVMLSNQRQFLGKHLMETVNDNDSASRTFLR